MESSTLSTSVKEIWPAALRLIDQPILYAIGAIIGSVITFLFGDVLIMYAFAGLLILDAITGWMKARNNGQKPDSQTFGSKTFSKLMAYLIVFLTVSCLSTIGNSYAVFAPVFTGLQIFVIWWICSREAISILENLNEGYGKNNPAIKHIYSRVIGLTKRADDKIDKYLDVDKKQ